MRSILRQIGFAFLAWFIPFAASVCLYPIKRSHGPIFDSLMGIILTGSTVLLFAIESRRVMRGQFIHAMKVGLAWVIANWFFDAFMFGGGPMKMSLGQYISEIGISYLMIPVITMGMGISASRRYTINSASPAS
jgi:uncharacterized membrane protein YpjA